jgi:hypothetical protein
MTTPTTVTGPGLPKVRANLIQGRSTPMVLVDQFAPDRVTMRLEIQDAERLLLELTAALHDLESGQ